MNTDKINKIMLASLWLLSMIVIAGCKSKSPIIGYDIFVNTDQNQMIVGLFSYDDLSIRVLRDNGDTEIVDVKQRMISETDLSKFMLTGPQTIRIQYNKESLLFNFELFPDTLVSTLKPFYDYMKAKNEALAPYSNWIIDYQAVALPITKNIDLFYHNQTFYYRYESEAEWQYLMDVTGETFEVDAENIYVGTQLNPKMVLPVSLFNHDMTTYLYDIYQEKNRHTDDFSSFILKWFTLSTFQQQVYRIDYIYNESHTTHGFGYDGEGIQSLPMHHKLGLEHLGWAESLEHSALFYGPIDEPKVLYPVYQTLKNGIVLKVLNETWDELQMDVVLSGHISLNGLDLSLLYDTNQYQILETIYHLDGIHHEIDGNISFNYMNVQSRLSSEQAIMTITFKKLNPTHDLSLIVLEVEEAIFINTYDRPELADYLNTQWIE
jgi:hypothetical protein